MKIVMFDFRGSFCICPVGKTTPKVESESCMGPTPPKHCSASVEMYHLESPGCASILQGKNGFPIFPIYNPHFSKGCWQVGTSLPQISASYPRRATLSILRWRHYGFHGKLKIFNPENSPWSPFPPSPLTPTVSWGKSQSSKPHHLKCLPCLPHSFLHYINC